MTDGLTHSLVAFLRVVQFRPVPTDDCLYEVPTLTLRTLQYCPSRNLGLWVSNVQKDYCRLRSPQVDPVSKKRSAWSSQDRRGKQRDADSPLPGFWIFVSSLAAININQHRSSIVISNLPRPSPPLHHKIKKTSSVQNIQHSNHEIKYCLPCRCPSRIRKYRLYHSHESVWTRSSCPNDPFVYSTVHDSAHA